MVDEILQVQDKREIVYVLQSHCRRYTKIGYTTNLQKRFKSLSKRKLLMIEDGVVDVDLSLNIVGFLYGGYDLECRLHNRFIRDVVVCGVRVNWQREWFNTTRQITQFIITETLPFMGFDGFGHPMSQLPLDLPPAAHSETEIAS